MLQYIINSTAIWLVALLAFDIFLRREAHHAFNRMYLLLMLFAGALIPLWSWDYDSVIYTTAVSQPIAQQTAAVRTALVSNSEQTILGWEQWLLLIYAAGVVVSLLLMIRDISSITRLFSKGKKHKHGTWTIIETGTPIAPFSAFRYVFISSRDNYAKEELAMILAHEEQHGHLLHFADVTFTRIGAVIFWFNPVIYLLESRLRMVHEYQADAAVDNYPDEYGRFLIEQSILGTAPMIAHSFTRSPIKIRIVMLTKKVNRIARGKQLVIVPVLLVAALCFTQNAFSGEKPEKEGNKITYKGNVFETKAYPADTMQYIDPVTGKMITRITKLEVPDPVIKMNGTPVKMMSDRRDNIYATNAMNRIKAEVGQVVAAANLKLPKGEYLYDLYNVVIDAKGDVVYYEVGGIQKTDKSEELMTPEMTEKINRDITRALLKLKFEPIIVNGKPEIYNLRVQDVFFID